MASPLFSVLMIIIIAVTIMAGCTSPASVPVTVAETTAITVIPTEPPTAAATPGETSPAPDTTVTTAEGATSTTEIYYDTVTIPMERKQYELINFEDIGYPYLNPGEKYIVRITSDHAIFAYVIATVNVPRLKATGGVPVFDKDTRTYEYGQLTPLLKLEDIREDGGSFTVRDIGKYTLVLDTRLSQRDYHFDNEMTTVVVRILKES